MLAIIHIVVGLITYFVYDHTQGFLFLLASAGYSAGAFLIIFNLSKGGLVLIAFFHFLDFGMMLYYGIFMLLFTCLLAEAAAFLIIMDVWRGYATDSEEPPPEVDLVTKKKADPLGFDSNYYYNRYYDRLEGKERAKAKRPQVKAKRPVARPKAMLKLQDDTSLAPANGGHRQASVAPAPDVAQPRQKRKRPAPKVHDRDRAGR